MLTEDEEDHVKMNHTIHEFILEDIHVHVQKPLEKENKK